MVQSDTREVKTTTKHKTGFLGLGPTVKETTYAYYTSAAIAFAQGQQDAILRIWANRKLIYDVTRNNKEGYVGGDTGASFDEASARLGSPIRYYPGSEDQLPDPKIAQITDEKTGIEGSCPAYRGIAYIVLDEYETTQFGGRLPDIEVEVSRGKEEVIVYDALDHVAAEVSKTAFADNKPIVDPLRRRSFVVESGVLYRIHYRSQELDDRRPIPPLNFVSSDGTVNQSVHAATSFVPHATDGDFILGQISTHSISIINASTGVEVGRISSSGIGAIDNAKYVEVDVEGQTNKGFWFVSGTNSSLALIKGDPDDWTTTEDTITDTYPAGYISRQIVVGPMVDNRRLCVTLSEDDNITEMVMHEWRIDLDGNLGGFKDFNIVEDVEPNPESLVFCESDNCIVYWYEDQGQIFIRRETPPSLNDRTSSDAYIETENSIEVGEETIQLYPVTKRDRGWSRRIDNAIPYGIDNSVIQRGEVQWIDGGVLCICRVYDGKLTYVDLAGIDATLEPTTDAYQFYDDRHGAIITTTDEHGYTTIFTGRVDRTAADLADVVADLLDFAGLDESQYLTTELEGNTVYGFVQSSEATVKDLLETLSTVYNFVGRESDGRLVFSMKSSDPVRTISEDELIDVEDGDKGYQRYILVRTADSELPSRVEITYHDLDRDYQEGHQRAKRAQFPYPTHFSSRSSNFSWPIVLIADDAKQQAEKLLYTAWIEKESKKLSLLPRHMDLDPGDVIQIEMNDGRVFRERITSFDLGRAFQSELETVAVYPETFSSAAVGSTGAGVPSQTIGSAIDSYLFLMDIPILALVDEPAGTSFIPVYMAVGAETDGWKFAEVQRSGDGLTYDPWQVANQDIPWGALTHTLEIPANGTFATDDRTTLTIKFETSDVELVSITQDEFLAGRLNMLLIDDEIVQYRDATQIDSRTWEVSHLRRGMFGTEWAVKTHGAKPRVIALQDFAVDIMPFDYTELDVQFFYRAVSKNQYQEEAVSTDYTIKGNAIRPWAPADIRAEVDGSDIDLSWSRRERLATQDWLTGDGSSLPNSEEDESYNVYFLASAHTGGDVPATYIRKETVTSPEITYTAAMQATDAFTLGSDILHVAVCQISGRIGDGFPGVLDELIEA
ncbi:phage tail protein [Candidatus Macondimonas diazotrophica]|uniref:phage tail protein n=1 Tax=Candidatus Macondimonas diazotrophica TaxID=2305248 RepID=UPI0014327CE1|nr:phage tail protein [Candidatus Macondimonas diazotrophica]